MTIEELINELKKFPPHYEAEAFIDGMGETVDIDFEIIGIEAFNTTKIVSIEINQLTKT